MCKSRNNMVNLSEKSLPKPMQITARASYLFQHSVRAYASKSSEMKTFDITATPASRYVITENSYQTHLGVYGTAVKRNPHNLHQSR